MANIQKIRKVVDFIEQMVAINPEKFNMDKWGYENSQCGTVACFAGWAPVAFGETVREGYVVSADKVRNWEGYLRHPHVAEWARKELDLDSDAGDDIFYAADIESVAELKRLINYVLDEEVFVV